MLANAVSLETTSTTSPYTVTSVTGFAGVAALVQDVLVPYEIKSGNDREWGFGHKTSGGTFAVDAITATLKSGTYANSGALTAITKSGTSELRISATADMLFLPDTDLYTGDVTGLISPHINRIGSTLGSQTLRYGADHYEVTRPGEYTEASVSVSSAATAGATMRIGIYAPASDATPGKLLAQSGAAELIDAAGTVTFTLDSGIYLPRGNVRIVYISTANAALTSAVTGYVGPTPFGSANPGQTYNFLRGGVESAMPGAMPASLSPTGGWAPQTAGPAVWGLN